MTLELKNNGWIGVPWAEAVGQHSEHGPHGSFGYDEGSSQMTYTIWVNWTDLPTAMDGILGTNIFSQQTNNLKRSLPAAHPVFPWMFARRIVSLEPRKWLQKSPGGGMEEATVSASEWKWALITIGFEVPKYRVLTDAQMASKYANSDGTYQEWERFTSITPRSISMTLSREGGAFKWADNGAGGTGAPTRGDSFSSPLSQTLNQDVLELRTHALPRLGLFDLQTGLVNSNIRNARNKVSSNTFLGYPPGTVRFDDYQAIPLGAPLAPAASGLSSLDVNCYYDLVCYFTIFDPPYGNSNWRGHNLAPNPGDNLWYLVTSDGTPTGATIYQSWDLSTIYKLTVS